jgi:hypothetical protein
MARPRDISKLGNRQSLPGSGVNLGPSVAVFAKNAAKKLSLRDVRLC